MAVEVASVYAKISADTAELRRGLSEVKQGCQEAKENFGNLGAAIQGALVAVGAAAATKLVAELAQVGAQAQQLRTNFERLSGESAAQGLAKLRQETQGLISDDELLSAANKFLVMGLAKSTEEAGKLAKMAAMLGGDMQGFALMLANQSIPRLDNYGISAGRVRQRIEELQKAQPGLARETAFMQAVMEEGERAMQRLGDQSQTTMGQMRQVGAAFANLKADIAMMVSEAVAPAIPAIKEMVGELGQLAASEQARSAIQEIGQAIVQVVSAVGDAVKWFANLSPQARNLGLAIAGVGVAIPALTAAFAALNAVLVANPILAVTAALVALGVAAATATEKMAAMRAQGKSALEELTAQAQASGMSYEEYTAKAYEVAKAHGALDKSIWNVNYGIRKLRDEGLIPTKAEWMAVQGALQSGGVNIAASGDAFAKFAAQEELFNAGLRNTRQTIDAELGAAALSVANFTGQVSASFAALRDQALADFATGMNQALAQAFSTNEVTQQLVAFQRVVYDHQQAMTQLEEEFANNRLNMQFEYEVQSLQARAEYEARYAALVAAGRTEDALKLQQSFQNQQALSKYGYSIQEQLQQRSLIIQKIQQQKAYIDQLKEQSDQVRRTLALKLTESEGFVKLTAAEQKALLDTIYEGGSKRLQMEREIGERSVEISKLVAQGNVNAAAAQVRAILALQKADIASAEATMKALQNQLANFKVQLPPLPTLDLREITVPDISSPSASRREAERASEPLTKTLAQVAQDIAQGVSAAKQAIRDLLCIELPEGIEQGLEKLGAFMTMAARKLYAISEPLKGELNALKERLEPLNQLMQLISSSAQALKGVEVRKEMPNLDAWGGQILALLVKVNDIVYRSKDIVKVEDAEKFKDQVAALSQLLSLATVDLSRVQLAEEMPNLDAWGQWMLDVLVKVNDIVYRFQRQVPQLDAEVHANVVPQLKALLELVPTNLAGLSLPEEMPSLDAWGQLMLDVLVKVNDIVYRIQRLIRKEDLEKSAERVAQIKPYLELIGANLSNLVPPKKVDIAGWGDVLMAALRRVMGIVSEVRRGISNRVLEQAAKASESLRKIAELLGVDLTKVFILPRNFGAALQSYMAGLDAAVTGIVNWITGKPAAWRALLPQVQEAAASIKEIVSLLGFSDVFQEIIDLKSKGFGEALNRYIADMSTAVTKLVPALNSLKNQTGDALEPAVETAKTIAALMSAIEEIAKATWEAAETGGINFDFMRGLILQLQDAARMLNLMIPENPNPTPVISGPGGAPPPAPVISGPSGPAPEQVEIQLKIALDEDFVPTITDAIIRAVNESAREYILAGLQGAY